MREMFFMTGKNRLRTWELALMIAVALAALVGSSLGKAQDELAEQVVRLHVIANSDSEEDQALKLKVRDRILTVTEPMIQGCNREETLNVLEGALPSIQQAAEEVLRENGTDQAVRVEMAENVWFPTKTYANFALPAGEYTALRVKLGQAEGKNWWCVLFPPLCVGSVCDISEEAIQAGLSQNNVALMTGETEGYVVKFRFIELWEELKQGLR